MATIYDIAKKANVSAMTVSRVINNTGRVSEKTRDKVKQVMEEMRYIPNSVARCLVTQESKIVSLLITDITNPFFTTMARGAEDAAMRHGYRLMFGNSDESFSKEKDYVEMILSMRVDGVLFAPSGDQSKEHLEWLQRQNVPFVLLDREVPGIDCDAVLGDSLDGAKRMVAEMIRYGHRRIALVNGAQDVSTARERQAGYIEALQEAGIELDESLIMQTSYSRVQDLSVAHWMELAPEARPTAIFAANNMLALSVLKSVRSLGLRVPDDLSIACFDDFGWVEEANPFFSVASQPAYEFGEQGMQLLLDRIKNREEQPRQIMLPCEILMRESVGKV
ncbi:LacI family transcriptional regulator [Paenibacillus thiaminolyticus]|uniref:LacI family transcriptional regulator n=1 Tax=Paenibacillus thiaminolyticus TaxID=49283 RepID=A0AAP9DT37_PANTH|nr:LacI family DNA-binding transcriptional regulator [Paenibacillus thiaminolyticus]MCY9536444.1 LacI family transcriptional regulator [Paenibacillus thiaminolyticus]MCY9601456.1 LacI family transcriptional regulator [Paenibacillus thiaminolyticus]MCY9609222.1 LacI family transcriptional regulator [Paenibacillus thiaminolyticus]MCY9613111.1 LacI family transcriptional regulator [Paenibacillus thiaminolyticus]MCY9616905.1 LacI family transcriptional regulator [Paenibacillus thiaminolyticus]